MRKDIIRSAKKVIATTVAMVMLGSTITVMADNVGYEQVSRASTANEFDNNFRYENEDSEQTMNSKISAEEKEAARQEKTFNEGELGYVHGEISISCNKSTLIQYASERNMDIYEILKYDLREFGDKGIYASFVQDDNVYFIDIRLNDNKSVMGAIKQYKTLDYVDSAYPNGVVVIDDPLSFEFSDCSLSYTDDSVIVNVNDNRTLLGNGTPYYCMYAYDYTNGQWTLIGGWQQSTRFEWKPDANDEYALVVYGGDTRAYVNINENGDYVREIRYRECQSHYQKVDRPQMGKKVTGDCAMATPDGLLFGCTSNVTASDHDYLTTCYIYSYTTGTWVAQAPYQALGCSWFRISSLPRGVYIMYTCTEKIMPDGQKRKLSCRYYPFAL